MRRSGQEDPNKILTDQMSNFWLPCRVRCPRGRSEGLWSAFVSIACGHHWADPAAPSISTFFSPCDRSFSLHSAETNGGTTNRVIDAFASFEELAIAHIEEGRSSCSFGVLMAFDDAAQTPSERPFGRLARPILEYSKSRENGR